MDQSIILLTYKGKILLIHKDYILETEDANPWHFISGIKDKNATFEESIYREVKRETSIDLPSVELLGSLDEENRKKYFYHATLTDENVNNMVHRDGKILGFFSVKELDTLLLSMSTKLLISRHRNILENPTQTLTP